MSKPSQSEPQVVAPRVDPVELPADGAPHTDKLVGKNPDFHYEWKSGDPDHPQFVGTYLKAQTLANGNRIAPWRVVCEDGNGEENIQIVKRFADDGESIDGVVRNRRDVLMAVPMSEYAKYAGADEALQAPLADQINRGQTEHYGGGADKAGVTNTAGFRQLGIPQR